MQKLIKNEVNRMLKSEELTLKLENVKNKIKTIQAENKIKKAHGRLAEIEN